MSSPYKNLGFSNQEKIIEKLKKYYEEYNKKHNTDYELEEVIPGSIEDRVKKIDFKVYDRKTKKKWAFDIKTSTHSDGITVNYINKRGESCKLLSDYENCPNFVFVFNDLKKAYILDKKTMKWILDIKLNNGKGYKSDRGYYIILTKSELQIAANKIIDLPL
jgi:hypothetical protein